MKSFFVSKQWLYIRIALFCGMTIAQVFVWGIMIAQPGRIPTVQKQQQYDYHDAEYIPECLDVNTLYTCEKMSIQFLDRLENRNGGKLRLWYENKHYEDISVVIHRMDVNGEAVGYYTWIAEANTADYVSFEIFEKQTGKTPPRTAILYSLSLLDSRTYEELATRDGYLEVTWSEDNWSPAKPSFF